MTSYPSPPQSQPLMGAVCMCLCHRRATGTDFVLTLFWFAMLYFDYFTTIANVNTHLRDSRIMTWALQFGDTDAFRALPEDAARWHPLPATPTARLCWGQESTAA